MREFNIVESIARLNEKIRNRVENRKRDQEYDEMLWLLEEIRAAALNGEHLTSNNPLFHVIDNLLNRIHRA